MAALTKFLLLFLMGYVGSVNAQAGEPCLGIRMGKVAHPTICNKYYQCSNSVESVKDCPSGQNFDPTPVHLVTSARKMTQEKQQLNQLPRRVGGDPVARTKPKKQCSPQNENLKRFVKHEYRAVSYYVSNDIYTTDDAAAKMCETICGYLAEVNKLMELDRIVSLMGPGDLGVLIGGTDKYREGFWEYARNRQPVQYLQWLNIEPNNYGGYEDCMCLFKDSIGLFDCSCARYDWELKYVCEVD